jgi:hypothetical protein
MAANGEARVGVVPSVEPDFAARRERGEWTIGQQLQAGRPASGADTFCHGFRRNGDRVLMADHRDSQRSVVALMAAGQCGQRQAEGAIRVAVFDGVANLG